MKTWYQVCSVACGVLLFTVPVLAEVVAKQGEVPETERETVFESPMVLELPAALNVLEEGEGLNLTGFERFVCADTRLTLLAVKKTSSSPRKGEVYTFSGAVAVGRSHDRLVRIELGIYLGDQRLGGSIVEKMDVEEGKQRTFRERIEVPPEAVASLRAAGRSAGSIRVTISVWDND